LDLSCSQTSFDRENIVKGFQSTSIYPLDPHAMDTKIEPSKTYGSQESEVAPTSRPITINVAKEEEELPTWEMQEILEEDTSNLPSC